MTETDANKQNINDANKQVKIIGARFKKAGRVYYFDPSDTDYKVNDRIIVNTPRGLKIGQVVIPPEFVSAAEITEPLKTVVRRATQDDIKRTEELAKKEPETLVEATKLVTKLNLSMKLVGVEYNLEGNQMTMFFTAEERVDFRELVKELNGFFKMRVELRQIGPRDEAKLVGGYGRCGRSLCCATFLDEFAPVSIKMAKQQGLALNPMKIAGSCGRLLCCLAYEAEPAARKPDKSETVVEDEEIPSEEIPQS
jgi:cell fate regulator YaaT (PSP1 superfamily)